MKRLALSAALLFTAFLQESALAVEKASIDIYYDTSFSTEAAQFENQFRTALKGLLAESEEAEIDVNFKPVTAPVLSGSFGSGLLLLDISEFIAKEDTLSSSLMTSITLPLFDAGTKTAVSLQEGEYGRVALASLSTEGYLGFSFLNSGTSLLVSRQPLKTPADLEGSKIAMPPGAFDGNFWNAFGAAPIVLSNTETQLALQTGSIDKAEVLPSWFSEDSAAETLAAFSDFAIAPSGRRRTAVLVAPRDWWDELHYLVRVPLAEAMKLAAAEVNKFVSTNEQELLNPIVTKFSGSYETDFLNVWSESQDSDYIEKIDSIRDFLQKSSYDAPGRATPVQARIFFVTNRGLSGSSSAKRYFDDRRMENLICGEVTQNYGKEVEIDSLANGNDQCFNWISKKTQDSSAIFLIHGFNNSFFSAALRALDMKRRHLDKNVILWSWPSRGETDDYLYDTRSIGKAYLHELVAKSFFEYFQGQRTLSVIAH
jgi:hypothetical protein